MSRGATKAPISYEGEYDATRTYLPRQIVTVTAGAVRTGYLSTATTTGDAPAATPTIWLPLGGGGGDTNHDGTGTNSTAVGTGATATADKTTALGDNAHATANFGATALGYGSTASAYAGVAVGPSASVTAVQSIAIGNGAAANSSESVVIGHNASSPATYGSNIAIGDGATVTQDNAVAIGAFASATYRSIAIGTNAVCSTAFMALLAANTLEVDPTTYGGIGSSRLVLHDTGGTRWALTIDTSGAVVVALA